MDPSILVVRFPKELKSGVRLVWHNALIVKLIGRSLRFDTMIDQLHKKWRTNEFDPLYLGNGSLPAISNLR